MQNKGRLIIGIITGTIIIALLGVSIFSFIHRVAISSGTVIADDIKQLAIIFDQIDKSSGILGFEGQQNPINFLTVEKFAGSEVGSMNLAYPDKWKGPYMGKNPHLEGKEYMVVRTKQGYFITPGNGVTLPSGAIIGKDIILDEGADINGLIANHTLYFRGRPLATKIEIEDAGLIAQIEDIEG